jgi:hypothetical protein
MKLKTLLALSVVLLGTAFTASAGGSWSVSVGFGGPAYYPAPVVMAPAYCPPPPIYYAPPPVVYYAPRPVCPPPRFAPPGHAWGHYQHGNRYDRRDNRYGHDSRGRDDRRGHQRDWQAGRR